VENQRHNGRLTGAPHGRPACTWRSPPLCFVGVTSSVLWNLLELFSSRIIVFNSDNWVHLDGFLNKPCWKHRFTKTHGICQFKPLNLCWWSFSCIYPSYVDGLWWMITTINSTRLRVRLVMPISAWTSKWVNHSTGTSLSASKWTSEKNHCVILSLWISSIDLLPGLAHSFLSLVFTFFHSRVVLVVASWVV